MTTLGRRSLLKTAATATAAVVVAEACGTPSNNTDGGDAADIAALNALAAAEYKAIDAYRQGAAVLQTDSSALGQLALAVAVEFQKDHNEHVALLVQMIAKLKGTPVTSADNTFTLPAGFVASTTNVLKLAANEERRAAIAYNQVLKGLSTANHRFIAAAIQGDESAHYAVLVALIEGLAVPTAALTTSLADQVVPRAWASSTADFGGSAGFEAEADIATNDMG